MLYNAVNLKSLVLIVQNQLKEILLRAKEQGLNIKVEKNVLEYLSKKGYDPNYGARPLKRILQKEVSTLLSKHILEGNLKKDKVYTLSLKDNKINLQ